jgi:hypothetical protein
VTRGGSYRLVPVEYTVSQKLLWLWHRDSSGTEEGGCQLLEAGTRGLEKRQQTGKTQYEPQ